MLSEFFNICKINFQKILQQARRLSTTSTTGFPLKARGNDKWVRLFTLRALRVLSGEYRSRNNNILSTIPTGRKRRDYRSLSRFIGTMTGSAGFFISPRRARSSRRKTILTADRSRKINYYKLYIEDLR